MFHRMGKWLLCLMMAIALNMAGIGIPQAGCNLNHAPAYNLAQGKAKAAAPSKESLPQPTAPDPTPVIGLTWHGTKALDIRYVTGKDNLDYQGTRLDPGFVLSQRLQAEVTGMWPGIYLQGSFDDDPFFPQYSLTIDTPHATAALGDTNTMALSPPLSPLELPLRGAGGRLSTGPFTFAFVAGHPRTNHQSETFPMGHLGSVYQTELFPIIPNTESVRVGDIWLVVGKDYLIDYELGQIELLRWRAPGDHLTITYQVAHHPFGKSPLLQGFRGQYVTDLGEVGITHLTRTEFEDSTRLPWSWPSALHPLWESDLTSSKLTWTSLSWEQGMGQGQGNMHPYVGAEIWRRTFQARDLGGQTVEDMEIHTQRRPLYSEIAHPHRWQVPNTPPGSYLGLYQENGWVPQEGSSRQAIKLDFALEGTDSEVTAILPLPKALNLARDNLFLLTLGISQTLPGIQMEIALNSGLGSSYTQSITLGTLIGWQDLILSPTKWIPVGAPAWDNITSIEITIRSGLPRTTKGEIMLVALDALRENRGTDRWHTFAAHQEYIDIKSIALPHAPWMPLPSNTALQVDIKPTALPPSLHYQPQICGELPKEFALGETKAVSLWAHTSEPNEELAIWLANEYGEPYGPYVVQLTQGWQQYTVSPDAIVSPSSWDMGQAGRISMIYLGLKPRQRGETTTILFDEWQIQHAEFTEDYMTRFAARSQVGNIDWELTGSGQTQGFRWDAPGMELNVPHPHHLRLQAIIHGAWNKETSLAIIQTGQGYGNTSLELATSTWDKGYAKAQINLPSKSPGGDKQPVTGHIDLQKRDHSTTWELYAFQRATDALTTDLSVSYGPTLRHGLSLGIGRQISLGHLHLGSWFLGEGEAGQTFSGDLKWQLSPQVPVEAVFRLHRYQESPTSLATKGGYGRLQSRWQSPGEQFSVSASLEHRQGQEISSFAKAKVGLGAMDAVDLPGETFWQADPASSGRIQQKAALGWRWQPARTVLWRGRWEHTTQRDLEMEQDSIPHGTPIIWDDQGYVSVSWPWAWPGPSKDGWRAQVTLSQATSLSTDSQRILTREYDLVSEGPVKDDLFGRLGTSHRVREWHTTDKNKGQRWAVAGELQHPYSSHGSLGLSLGMSYQTAHHLGGNPLLAGNLQYTTPTGSNGYDPMDSYLLENAGQYNGFPSQHTTSVRAIDAPGTSLSTNLRWTLAKETIYRASIGSLTHMPTAREPNTQIYYGLVAIEKALGLLGHGHAELATELGPRPAWTMGIGLAKRLNKGEEGLSLEVTLRHTKGMDYEMTVTSLGLEYAF